MIGVRHLVGVFVCVSLSAAAPVDADVVTDWNSITTDTMIAAGPVPPNRNIEYAMVNIAMHDAVQSIQGRFETYIRDLPRSSGSEIAAAAKAARDVLVNRFPAQASAIEASYQAYLSAHQIAPNDAGITAGAQSAAAIIQNRVDDGSYPVPAPIFLGGMGVGEWRPTQFTATTPPEPVPMVTPWLGTMRTFAVEHQSQMFAPTHPRLTSNRYTQDYNEVKELGRNVGSTRTPQQTDLAVFYSDSAILYWNRTLRALADRYLKDPGESARMFALAYLAIADAGMTAWHAKTQYNLWRPVTAIQLGETDGNRHTAGDPTWQPFLATPNYPDYTSGANSAAGSATEILRLFFGTDRMPFSVIGANSVRDYLAFSDMADDIVDVRIYQGIHFRFADEEGRSGGMRVARYVFKYFLRSHSGADDDTVNALEALGDSDLIRLGDDGQDDSDRETP